MSGLVSGLQNRARRFESARNLKSEGWLINLNQPSGFYGASVFPIGIRLLRHGINYWCLESFVICLIG